jgi:hypothetical protein
MLKKLLYFLGKIANSRLTRITFFFIFTYNYLLLIQEYYPELFLVSYNLLFSQIILLGMFWALDLKIVSSEEDKK